MMKVSKSYKLLKICAVSFAMVGVIAGCSAKSDTDIATMEVSQPSAYDTAMAELASRIENQISEGIPVPFPKDAGGGYTHEQHKQNGKTIYEAGMLYLSTGDEKYRNFARDVLFDYADLYPTLGLHPEEKNQAPGKLFWQGLNEAVWLVYVIQGYEVFKDDLTQQERSRIEDGVLNPMADFLSVGSPQTFDRIHNHGTWAAAAVGMTGYVLDQKERVEQALLGLDKSGNAGFLKQLDMLFSPDGYYAEGPYYQRYALMPFVLFAQAIEKNDPDRRIFEYRDGIVLKAIRSTVQQSYAGRFFPINDAIREKGLNTVELKYALAIAYDLTKDPTLLGAAQLQNGVVPTSEGKLVADAIQAGKAEPFEFKSLVFRDGPSGEEGGLVVLRSGADVKDTAVVMKATSQGLGHGHFDKLGLLYFDNLNEITADYGAVRFLNVEPKFGGRYLPENTSWGKQSIAHNTLVVDETSHFGGDWKLGQKHSPQILSFEDIGGIQIAAAEIDTAYENVNLQRIVGLVPRNDESQPYVIDIVRGIGQKLHQYDLPIHLKGQLIETNFPITHEVENLKPLGAANGYQHLWKKAESPQLDDMHDLSLLVDDRFYTLSFKSDQPLKVLWTELGANDPDNNLRREQAAILRTKADKVNYVTVYESGGRYDSDEEITVFNGASIKAINIEENSDATVFRVATSADEEVVIILAADTSDEARHSIEINNQKIEWQGALHAFLRSHDVTSNTGSN